MKRYAVTRLVPNCPRPTEVRFGDVALFCQETDYYTRIDLLRFAKRLLRMIQESK